MGRRSMSAGLRSLYEEFVGSDPERVNHFEHTLAALEVSVAINRLRTDAGLTMKELAARVGTQPSAIARLERADYEGHSLGMLRRIAAALGRRVEVRFPCVEVKPPSGSPKATTAPKSKPPAAPPLPGAGGKVVDFPKGAKPNPRSKKIQVFESDAPPTPKEPPKSIASDATARPSKASTKARKVRS